MALGILWNPVYKLIQVLGNIDFVAEKTRDLDWNDVGNWILNWGWAPSILAGFVFIFYVSRKPLPVDIDESTLTIQRQHKEITQLNEQITGMQTSIKNDKQRLVERDTELGTVHSELSNARRIPDQNKVSAAISQIQLTPEDDLRVNVGTEKEILLRFLTKNWSEANIEFDEAVEGRLAADDGPIQGTGYLQGAPIVPRKEAVITLRWGISDALAETLAFYAGSGDRYVFDGRNVRIKVRAQAGEAKNAFTLPLPSAIPVVIPDIEFFARIREKSGKR